MESTESKIHPAKSQLTNALAQYYPNVKFLSEWEPHKSNLSADSLMKAKINKTYLPAVPRTNSSGKSSTVEIFDEVAPNDSASLLGSRSMSILGHLAHIAGKTQKTIITVSYKDYVGIRTKDFDVTTCLSWTRFLNEVDKSPELAIPIHARKIYRILPDGRHSYVSELTALQSGEYYFVETDLNKPLMAKEKVQFSTMEGFFEKLKSDRKRPESDITKLREIFTEQGILFDDLMETGDLAITDEKLKEDGIIQRGLRTAILAVIKSNQ